MNLFVADPHWGWWITLYFFFGGIAAGVYFLATLIDLIGSERDRDLARIGYWVAFPIICLCGIFLTVDLDRPERFWHMLLKSEVVHEGLQDGSLASRLGQVFLFKYWSPMSVGSWALLLFGICSGLSLLGTVRRDGRLARLLRHSLLARLLQLIGVTVGFFVAAYTGALLTATNQPVWSDSPWIAALFLTSAASTGIATLILLAHFRPLVPADSVRRLERANLWALGLELLAFALFLGSLGGFVLLIWETWHGKVLIVGTLLLGLVVPLAIHLRARAAKRPGPLVAAAFALLGGFVLRYGILTTPPELLSHPAMVAASGEREAAQSEGTGLPFVSRFSPEDGRTQGDGPGADPGNKPADIRPRSKVYTDE